MTNYYVHYVDNSTPLLKKFKSLKAAKAFRSKYIKDNPNPMDGYWVDFIVAGEILEADDHYQEQL